MSIDRHQSRILAMQSLCHHDAQGGDPGAPLATLGDEAGATQATIGYARSLCERYALCGREIDARIQAVVAHWGLSRVDSVARNVLRVAAIELALESVPSKVAIDEAIELAREFGDDEMAKFVNGVVDALLKQTGKEA